MPATEKLFETREDSDPKKKLFNKKWAQKFHHSAAQGLFITTRYCQNIWTQIALLCIRVKCPYEDNRGKPKHLLKYIHGTFFLVLAIEAANMQLGIIKWYVDAAFAFNPEFKPHSGADMTLGIGGCDKTVSEAKIKLKRLT